MRDCLVGLWRVREEDFVQADAQGLVNDGLEGQAGGLNGAARFCSDVGR